MKSGPIIIIEDDPDDKEIMEDVIRDLNYANELIWFNSTLPAFEYLISFTKQPFIIFCDVNLPTQNGIEFKRQIDKYEELRKKSIPFVFYSTAINQDTVDEAYTHMTVQGFFQKKNNYQEIKNDIKLILDYWHLCRHPNND